MILIKLILILIIGILICQVLSNIAENYYQKMEEK